MQSHSKRMQPFARARATRYLRPVLGVIALLGVTSTARAANICFPTPISLPGLSGPPNWDQPGTVRTDVDDPRWAAAPLSPFAMDLTGTLGRYRLMQNATGDKIYVSLRTSADGNNPTAPDRVIFGFSTSVGMARGVVINMATTSAAGTFAVPPVSSFTEYEFNSAQSVFSPFPSTKPAWLTSPAVFTNAPGGDVDWAVNFIVDLGSLGLYPDQSLRIAIGMLIRDQDGEDAIYTPAAPLPGSAVQPFQNVFANPAEWAEATPLAYGCPGGITLESSQITTTNPDPAEIDITEGHVNVFQVRPALGVQPQAPNMLRAELRIAGWSAVDDPQAGWSLLPGAAAVPNGAPLQDLGLIEFVCPANTATHVCGVPLPAQREQALQVRLNHGGGFDQTTTRIAQASAYRRMRFGPPSSGEGGESSGGAAAGGNGSGEAGAASGAAGEGGGLPEPGAGGATGEGGAAHGGTEAGEGAAPSAGVAGAGGTSGVNVNVGSVDADLNCNCRVGVGAPTRSPASLALLVACAAFGWGRRRAQR